MKSRIIIVSIGPGDPDLLNTATVRSLHDAEDLILRTGRHPLSSWLTGNGIPFSTLDDLYEQSEDFDQLDELIVSRLLERASCSSVVYAVPDAATDHTVRALFTKKTYEIIVDVVPGVSTYDICNAAVLPFPNAGTSLLTAPASDLLSGFFYDPNQSLLITEIDNAILAGEIKILLSEYLDDEYAVYLMRYGLPPVSLPLYELDRLKDINHLTCILVPGSGFRERRRFVMNDLVSIMDKLRSPEGCPWDRIQSHQTLQPYVVEEAWECVAAIRENDMDHLCEELGDLLFQVVFHASIGKAYDEFTIGDVMTSICAKMLRRHPHVFADVHADTAESVHAAWEKIKEEETGHQTVAGSLEDVPSALPSLKYAAKTLKKLSGTESGIAENSLIVSDIMECVARIAAAPEQTDEEALGNLLFLCAALCFRLGIDSELVLHGAVDRLRSRVISVDRDLKKRGKSLKHLTFDELRVYLNHVEGEIE